MQAVCLAFSFHLYHANRRKSTTKNAYRKTVSGTFVNVRPNETTQDIRCNQTRSDIVHALQECSSKTGIMR